MKSAIDPLASSSWREPLETILANGVRVLFAAREGSPIVELRLVLEGGFGVDPAEQSGLAGFATAMVREGLLTSNGIQLGTLLEPLGALTIGQVMPDAAVVGLSALSANVGDALDIFADALTKVDFKAEDFELLRASRLALIAAERLDPFQLALRVLPPMVYGGGHIYARPFSGSGTAAGIARVTSDDLLRYYAARLVRPRLTLVVAGSFETSHIRARLEENFGRLSDAPDVINPTRLSQNIENAPSLLLVNSPDASQTVVAAALGTIPRNSGSAEALMVADIILGGIFTSRLNLSLREQKGWTYGVRSSLLDASHKGLWLIRTAVQADRTEQTMAEIARELENLAGRQPVTSGEFDRAVNCLVARIPSNHETSAQMADGLAQAIIYGLPVSYPQNLASNLRRLKAEQVTETCRQILATGNLRWMVHGDAARLAEQLSSAAQGKIQVVDSNSTELP